MAVTPMRRSLRAVPSPQSAPVPLAAPPQPAQQGWVWDGANWVWDPDCFLPQPPTCPSPPVCPMPPVCPPQWCPPFQCNFPPPPLPPPLPPPPLTGPIVGVTDGSNAAPGQVGEFITATATAAYAAYPALTTAVVSALVVQPGDWDLWGYLAFSTTTGGGAFTLSPVPTGMSNPMGGWLQVSSTASLNENLTIIGAPARGLFTIPTLLAYQIQVDQAAATGLPAGTATLVVSGRRRR